MTERIAAALEAAGVAFLAISAFLVAPALGFAVFGAGCIAFGVALTR